MIARFTPLVLKHGERVTGARQELTAATATFRTTCQFYGEPVGSTEVADLCALFVRFFDIFERAVAENLAEQEKAEKRAAKAVRQRNPAADSSAPTAAAAAAAAPTTTPPPTTAAATPETTSELEDDLDRLFPV